jgi:hypothetical protein
VSEPITGTVFAEYAYELGKLRSRVSASLALLEDLGAARVGRGYRQACVARIRELLTGGKEEEGA